MTTATTILSDVPGAGMVPSPQRKPHHLPAIWYNTKARLGIVIVGFFILIAIFGPLLAPYNPSAQSTALNSSVAGPSLTHLLGTDQLGRDVLSQILVGTRTTIVLGLLTGIIATFLSVAIGISAGFLGGLSDELLSLISNVFLVFPALPFLIVVLGAFPKSGETPEIILLAVLGWPWGARVIRAQTLSLRNRDFVAASRETGEKSWRIIFLEILPNEISLIAASFVGTVLYAIGASVGLDFLGVGNTTTWSLGTILYWAQNGNALQLGAWWWFAIPGICVALIGTGLVLLNFGLDELGNPRLKDAAQQRKINGRTWRPADPTPVIRNHEAPRSAPLQNYQNGLPSPSSNGKLTKTPSFEGPTDAHNPPVTPTGLPSSQSLTSQEMGAPHHEN